MNRVSIPEPVKKTRVIVSWIIFHCLVHSSLVFHLFLSSSSLESFVSISHPSF